LAKGLKNVPNVSKYFNKDWFEEEIMKSYREILKKYPIVETENGLQKLYDDQNNPFIIFPEEFSKQKSNSNSKSVHLYDLMFHLFPSNRFPLKRLNLEWNKMIWNEYGIWKLSTLCNFIHSKACVKNISLHSGSNLTIFEWLNLFFDYIQEIDETLFKKFSIIPNFNEDFVSLKNEQITEGKNLTVFMINCLKDLGEDITPILINEKITTIHVPLKLDKEQFAKRINQLVRSIIKNNFAQIKSIQTIIGQLNPILRITPTDEKIYSHQFITTQKEIQYLSSTLFQINTIHIENNDIPINAWKKLHSWIIEELILKVSSAKNINSLIISSDNKIEWLNRFYPFIFKECKEGE
jgi:hypothetical protein